MIELEEKATDRKTIGVLMGVLGYFHLDGDTPEVALPYLRAAVEKSPQSACLLVLLRAGLKRQRENLLLEPLPFSENLQRRIKELTHEVSGLEERLEELDVELIHQSSSCPIEGGGEAAAICDLIDGRFVHERFEEAKGDEGALFLMAYDASGSFVDIGDHAAACNDTRDANACVNPPIEDWSARWVRSGLESTPDLLTAASRRARAARIELARHPGIVGGGGKTSFDFHNGGGECHVTGCRFGELTADAIKITPVKANPKITWVKAVPFGFDRDLLTHPRGEVERASVQFRMSMLYDRVLTLVQAARGSGESDERNISLERRPARALSVGINNYNGTIFQPLAFAARDAIRVAGALHHLGYAADTRLDDGINREVLLRLLKEEAAESQPGDRFALYYSGHGVSVRSGERALVLPKKAGSDDVEAVTLQEIAEILSLHRGTVVVFADSCFNRANMDAPRVANSGQFIRGTHTPVFLVAGSRGEIAVESPQLRSGIYTKALVEYLQALRLVRRPVGQAADLNDWAMFTHVGRETERLSATLYQVRQTPQVLVPVVKKIENGPLK
ncbi:MAG TPA: caspase family protein [Thermoanaerobaculia bacterium]|nr:caspase family protein [Thermoanaerobaculia bacterium]